MNAELLLSHFHRIGDAPNAIPRLRHFILELAIRGKLIKQDPTDEPVSALINRIYIHKTSTAPYSKRRNKLESQSSAEELAFSIPPSWARVPLGSITICRDGERIPVSEADRSGRAKLYDYYGASGVIDKIDNYLFDMPLLLIGEDGANLINRSTPIAFMARGKYWVNNHAHVLDGVSENLLRFIELYINAIDLKPYVTGTAQPKMNQAKMNSIPVALPPEKEQERILSKVDELTALCDQLEAANNEQEHNRSRLTAAASHTITNGASYEELHSHATFYINHIDELTARRDQMPLIRKTIINLAVRGLLTAQDAREECAGHLLARIMARRESPKSLPPLPKETEPYPIPNSWNWIRFGAMITKSEAGWSPKTEGFPRSGQSWGVLKVSAVSWDRFLPDENKQLMPGVVPPERIRVRRGDFLISRANTSELVAKCVVVEEEPHNLILSDKIVRLHIDEDCCKDFYSLVNNHATYARDYYAEEASGTSHSMKNVSREVIYALPVPLPPAKEQERIVARVRELMALCDQLEAQLTNDQVSKSNLLESVLHYALNDNQMHPFSRQIVGVV